MASWRAVKLFISKLVNPLIMGKDLDKMGEEEIRVRIEIRKIRLSRLGAWFLSLIVTAFLLTGEYVTIKETAYLLIIIFGLFGAFVWGERTQEKRMIEFAQELDRRNAEKEKV